MVYLCRYVADAETQLLSVVVVMLLEVVLCLLNGAWRRPDRKDREPRHGAALRAEQIILPLLDLLV